MTATMSDTDYFTAHEGAIAMSLYIYNVAAVKRAKRLHEHFKGACNEMEVLLVHVDEAYWATHMPYPASRVYMEHALAVYGEEARQKILGEKGLQRCAEHDVDFPISEGCAKCHEECGGSDPDDGYKDWEKS